MEIDFFKDSTRSAKERIELAEKIEKNKLSKNYMAFGYDYFDNKDFIVGYQGYKYDTFKRSSSTHEIQ